MTELPRLFTSRYFAEGLLSSGQVLPVGISFKPPAIPLAYEVVRGPTSLVPERHTLGEWAHLSKSYWEKLDSVGPERIGAELAAISERHGGLPLALLCWEDLTKGHLCYRVTFSCWWEQQTGRVVPELLGSGESRHYTELHARVKVKRPKAHDHRWSEDEVREWPLSHGDVAKWIAGRFWQFARTAPTNPHQYTHREWGNEEMFEKVVLHARENGRQEVYAGREYTVFDLGPHFYWTMSDEIATTVILNRKFHDPEAQARLAEEQTGKSREELGLKIAPEDQNRAIQPRLSDIDTEEV